MKINLKLYGLDAVLVALAGILSHTFLVTLQSGDIETAYCILVPLIGLILMGSVELIGSYRKEVQHRINRISIVLKQYHKHRISEKVALSKIDDLFLSK